MSRIVTLSGSPSSPSRTDGVLSHVTRRLVGRGHEVAVLQLRDLPAAALLGADLLHPEIAAAVALVANADAVVVGSPVYKAAYSGLLKAFLDLLPQFALQGKDVLPIVTGGSPAHVLAVDYALRPVLASMNPAHIGQGWFVSAGHVTLYPDGGVLLDEAAARPLFEVVDAFANMLDQRAAARTPRLLPVQASENADPISVVEARITDDIAAPLLADLRVEYGTRYAAFDASEELTRYPAADFEAPSGAFLLLVKDGEAIAGGAVRRYDDHTAEVKRVWTSQRHRRRGLARRVMVELERKAAELGYRRIYLTTGPRQPEAVGLYLASGYTPQFDIAADPESIGPLPFFKDLPVVPAAEVPRRRQAAFAAAVPAGRAS